MTYANLEESLDSGSPIELYEFTQGLRRWHFVAAEKPYTRGSVVYTPTAVRRDRVKLTNDIFKDGLKLTFPRDDAFASQYLGFAPEDVTTVLLLRGHRDDPDAEFVSYWKGRVAGARATGNAIDVECESVYTSVRRPGLRARFEYGCRHTLYGSGCNVNRTAFQEAGTVTAVAGGVRLTIPEADGFEDGWFRGGMLMLANGVARFVVDHIADQVTLARPLEGLHVGAEVTLFPGCDHLKGTCKAKFDNLDNFGGFPYVPTRNPFDGSSIV